MIDINTGSQVKLQVGFIIMSPSAIEASYAWLMRQFELDAFNISTVVSRGAVRSAASSYAAMRMVAVSRPVLVIA